MGTLEDVANDAEFLASDLAAFVGGQHLRSPEAHRRNPQRGLPAPLLNARRLGKPFGRDLEGTISAIVRREEGVWPYLPIAPCRRNSFGDIPFQARNAR